jgi:nitrogen-specific signal transduction histidine kinase
MWDYVLEKSKDNKLKKEKDQYLYFKIKQNHVEQASTNQPSEKQEKKKLQVHLQSVKTSFAKTIVVTTVRDITPMKELEKQRALIKLKTVAFGSAAHELKNPLNAINNSLNLLEGRITNPRDITFFNMAKNCSKLMLSLVKDF